MLSALTTVSPSGFSRSEAIFATSLLGATPTEAASCVVARIRCLMPRAMVTASPLSARLAVTSRKASSSDRPSTTGVYSWKTANTWCETSRYTDMRGLTQMACGQRRSASRIGMAERTPNLRTS